MHSPKKDFSEQILASFIKKVSRSKKPNTGLLLVHAPALDLHCKFAFHPDKKFFTHPDQPYHFASIGKTITAVMICKLYESGQLHFDEPVSKYLEPAVWQGLHVWRGEDLTDQITIRHLLKQTSGLADYYLDKPRGKQSLLQTMLAEPDRFWTPMETINWVREHLTPKSRPGKKVHYADTNYQLLGLVIERITRVPLHEALQQYVFSPLGMDHTYMIFYSQPHKKDYPMVDLYHQRINLSRAKSISMSWASGGIVSTSEDMLIFLRAMVEHQIISAETLQLMQDFSPMGPGMYYGFGLMNFRFMLMPKKYQIWGHSGSIGAVMYYNPAMNVYIIGSFHRLNYQVQPIIFIINLLRKINKQLKKVNP